ncbi:hypothetical protein WJX72_002145 [[Myrmecia] bisecta]|uniref:TauD/TfdA-like domain-containing protein n=1 Tax=[Myrmecia] bisecta TaxID=41462 RepID=A0AAW1Q6N2_9CHLO
MIQSTALVRCQGQLPICQHAGTARGIRRRRFCTGTVLLPGLLVQASGAEQPPERIKEEKISGLGPFPAQVEVTKSEIAKPSMGKQAPTNDAASDPPAPDPNVDDPYQGQAPNPIEQIQAQAEVDEEIGEEPPKRAPPGATKQLLVVMRHGQRIDEITPGWSAEAKRPYDPYLSPKGEQQARDVAAKLKQFDIKRVYISPFYRCLQTAMFAMEGVKVPAKDWTVTTSVGEFMNPGIMVKKGGSVPPGHINNWFWEKGNTLKEHLSLKLPKEIFSQINIGQDRFGRFPENLANSRKRYIRAFQAIADEADGENVLVVTHGDAVNASVSRLMPWAIVHPVLHTGFTVASRKRQEDGTWSKWHLDSKNGETGVHWYGQLQPAFHVFKGAIHVGKGAWGLANKVKPCLPAVRLIDGQARSTEMAAAVAHPLPVSAYEKDYHSRLETYKREVEKLQLPEAKQDPVQHSGPQGKVRPLTIIDDPAAWKASDFKSPDEYTYYFTKEEQQEIIDAAEKLKARGVRTEDDILALTREDYEYPTLETRLLALAKQVNSGRGFQIIKNFPVEHYADDRLGLVLAYWGLALTVGRPQVSQTDFDSNGKRFGSLLNHVTVGRHTDYKLQDDLSVKRVPNETSNKLNVERLVFHADQGATDIISLLSISAAPEGGESKLVSSIAIHNELLRRGRKDLVEELAKPNTWFVPKLADQTNRYKNEQGEYEYEEVIPFEYHSGYLTVYNAVGTYRDAELTPLQEEAKWAVAKLAEDPDFHLAIKLQPGDIEWIHNPSTFHSRNAVKEGEAPDQKRHLLRWWVAGREHTRPIARTFAPRSSIFPEGGFRVPEDSPLRLPLYPYTRHDGQGQSPY